MTTKSILKQIIDEFIEELSKDKSIDKPFSHLCLRSVWVRCWDARSGSGISFDHFYY